MRVIFFLSRPPHVYSLRQPTTSCKIPASPYTNGGAAAITQTATAAPTKHSMLDKFRLFKEKPSKSQISKRTSSSSGFSSARSERSDSSVSLNEAHNPKKQHEAETTKKDTANSAKSKSKLLSSKPKDKKDKNKDKKNAIEHYQDSNITIVDSKIAPPRMAASKSNGMSNSNISLGKETKSDSKLKPPMKKLEVKSESRTSLSSISSNSKPLAPVNTGIPKPMAAIKGTTKPAAPEPTTAENNNFEKPVNGNVEHSAGHPSDPIYRPEPEMIHQSSPIVENGNKYNTVPSKLVNATIYEEEKQQQQQQQQAPLPMRPLLRGYNSHVTLPTRGARGGQLVSEYCDDGTSGGYCSDGDALRKLPVTTARFSDCENGYMSEGGTPTKHYLSVIRARTQLPTTIAEER